MTTHPTLIGGAWRDARPGTATISARNPATGEFLPDSYPVSTWTELEAAIHASHEAKTELRSQTPEISARFLETYAAEIEARADALVEMAHLETALPREPRLRTVELPRATGQLRQAAAAARDRSWRRATIDTKTNIRSILGPLDGPVVVFGPNNFPYAFNGVSGGDFAAAIAAGNPVIAKANPGHPGTTRLLAEAALTAIGASGAPASLVQMLYHLQPEDGLRLVSHPLVGATAFTGSRRAGMALKEAADGAGKPIYLEMSSVNPVFILPGALQERLSAIAGDLSGSCTLGVGQFCTKPGVAVLLAGEQGEAFVQAVAGLMVGHAPGVLLSERAPGECGAAVATLQAHGAEVVVGGTALDGPGYRFANTVLNVSGDRFLLNAPALQTEVFGPAALLVLARSLEQMLAIARSLEGNLTASVYSHTQGQDDDLYDRLEPILRQKVGRLLNDKMPTGVAVVTAMNHGGPFPATGHPGFTAVGIPASMLRFAALHGYDNVRPQRLPVELRDENPTGRMWRFVDGEWTQSSA